MPLYSFEDLTPAVAEDAFVHPEAVLIGAVTIGSRCFVGAGAVLRADLAEIRVEDGSCVQENCVVHAAPGLGVLIQQDVIVGHGAILHDVTIRPGAVVGMGAVLLEGVVVEKGAMVAAGSVVPSRFVIPAGKIVGGNPAKVVKDLPESYREFFRAGLALYQGLPERYRKGLRRIG
ncbi:MAG: gamma carbonic anhydrase family protein [bacterium]